MFIKVPQKDTGLKIWIIEVSSSMKLHISDNHNRSI